MSVMRRKDKEITEKVIIEEIFRQNQVGRLGMAVDNKPYIVPMNFAYFNGSIYLHSHKDGTKMSYIKQNPNVCFEVDDGEIVTGENPCDFSWMYKSAMAYGKARIIESDEERQKALGIISDKYSFGKSKLITPELMAKFGHLTLIEIKVDKMTGKQSPAPKKD
ncbi:MAG: pyridoxamine 5'-phosphate oxidase family protein [Candidatus Bathyarchaeota archaeon]|nr:pyridoxamine 5'-phosphate oxidase family protein [Candidatus Bathyarchaeota archaeon]